MPPAELMMKMAATAFTVGYTVRPSRYLLEDATLEGLSSRVMWRGAEIIAFLAFLLGGVWL